MILDRLHGYRSGPLRIAAQSVAERRKERQAEERKDMRGAEPLLGLLANDALPLDQVDPELVGRLLEDQWKRIR